MDNLKRREALKIVLGGVGGYAAASALPKVKMGVVEANSGSRVIGTPHVMSGFPPAGRYEITSRPIFQITKGGKSEVIVCQATLTMQTGEPFLNADHKMQVNVEILDWKGTSVSEILGGPLTLRMTGKSEKASFVLGGKAGDFPAEVHLAVAYEIKTPTTVISGLTGVMKGTVRAFPPLPADLLTMEKVEVQSLTAKAQVIDVKPIALAC